MKKSSLKILLIGAFVFLTSLVAFSQTDSTAVVVDNATKGILSAVGAILSSQGVNVTPFWGIVSMVVLWIVRYVEKRVVKAKTAGAIQEIIYTDTGGKPIIDTATQLPVQHLNAFQKLIHKLEGKK